MMLKFIKSLKFDLGPKVKKNMVFEGWLFADLTSHGRVICYRVRSNRLSSGVSDLCRALYQHGINHNHCRNLTITSTRLLLIFKRAGCPHCAFCTSCDWYSQSSLSQSLYPLCCVSFMLRDSYLSVIWLPLSAFPAREGLCLGARCSWCDKRWIISFQTP